MDSELTALSALKAAREQRQKELAQLEAAIRQVEAVIGREPGAPSSTKFVGKKIGEAAEMYLTELGKPGSTREMAEALLSGGITSTSKNFTMTLYAILNENRKFRRTEDGMWELVKDEGVKGGGKKGK